MARPKVGVEGSNNLCGLSKAPPLMSLTMLKVHQETTEKASFE